MVNVDLITIWSVLRACLALKVTNYNYNDYNYQLQLSFVIIIMFILLSYWLIITVNHNKY